MALGSSRIARAIFKVLLHHAFALRTSMKITPELPCIWFAFSAEMRGTWVEAASAAAQFEAEAADRTIKKLLVAKSIRKFMVDNPAR
jgi:hypothetical protein